MNLIIRMRKIRRLYRHLTLLIFGVLMIQIFFTFYSASSLLEEKTLRRPPHSLNRQKILIESLLENPKSIFDRNLNDSAKFGDGKKYREQFIRNSKSDNYVFQDYGNRKHVIDSPKLVPESITGVSPIDAYKPSCQIAHKDAQSALARATTESCKQQIADTVCRAQNQTLFLKSLPRSCPYSYKFTQPAPIPADDGEGTVKICFILVVHGRAVRQFKRLFKALYHRDHYFYIHIDIRSDHLHREILKISKNYPNVEVAPWRMATIWGGSSLLQMLLRAMNDVLKLWTDWDFFINLSALDFPVETNEKLVRFLSAYRDKNFMKSHGRDDEKFIRKQGLNKIFVECDQHMWRVGDRSLIEGITLNGGSDWVALNRKFCEYVITGDDPLLRGLKHWYRYTLLPAESFFHTLAQNGDECTSYVDNNLRVTNWNRARGCKCQYKHIVDWCGCSPNDFYPRDLNRLQTSRPVFFARKFEESINQEVVNHLDFKLYGKYSEAAKSISSYWENMYDHEDDVHRDDIHTTHFHAFARIGLSNMNPASETNEDCVLTPTKLKSVEMYRHKEEFKGYVVTFDARWFGEKSSLLSPAIPMQALISPTPNFTILDNQSPLTTRLDSAMVGTNWDVKELVMRDWGGIIGPNSSKVRLICRWLSSKEDFLVTVVVIDPLNVIADYNDFKTPSKQAGVTDTPLNLKNPIRPGVWKLRFYVHRKFQSPVAELKFVVAPLQYRNGQIGDISIATDNRGVANDDELNSANKNLYSIRTSLNLNRDNGAEESLEERATYVGEDLESWIDEILKEVWNPEDFCIASVESRSWWNPNFKSKTCQNIPIKTPPLCRALLWSSLSPDPKSELGPVRSNGRIR